MKIAFWSEMRQSGTTSNMLAVAEMTARIFPESVVAVQRLSVPQGAKEKSNKKNVKSQNRQPSKTSEKETRAADFYFLDCGTGLDEKKCRILKQMDVVVVNLRQDRKCLDDFFLRDRQWFPNYFAIISDFYGEHEQERCNLERRYRLKAETAAIISHNSAFACAKEAGKIRRFTREQWTAPTDFRNEQFVRELEWILTGINKCIKNKEEITVWNR